MNLSKRFVCYAKQFNLSVQQMSPKLALQDDNNFIILVSSVGQEFGKRMALKA